MKKLLITAALFGLAWLGYQKAMDLYEKVEFGLSSFKITGVTAKNINATARLTIKNPTPAFLSFISLRSDVLYKNFLLTKFKLEKPVDIKAESNTGFTVPLVIPIASFTGGAQEALKDIIATMRLPEVQMKGRIDFSKGGLDFDITKKLEA